MKKKKGALKKLTPIPAAAAMLALAATGAHAQTTPVFNYNFSTWPGAGDVTDSSSAGNYGTYNGAPALETTSLPSGATAAVNTSAGGFDSSANKSLANSALATAGGFTMNIEFMWGGSSTSGKVQTLLDYAGTESLQLSGSTLEMQYASDAGAENVANTYTIQANTWYDVTLDFDTTGNSLVGNDISGLSSLYVDGTLIGSAEATKGDYGDNLDRGIGVGEFSANSRYGLKINDFQGDIATASVDLGNEITPTPEPSSVSLALLGGFGMMGMMWNARRRKASSKAS